MQTFTLESIEKTRMQYADRYPTEQVLHKGRHIQYFVLPATMFPIELRTGVIRKTPDSATIRASPTPETTCLFGVSKSVPPIFRGFCIIHEAAEFLDIGLDTKGRCAKATEEEIMAVRNTRDLNDKQGKWYFQMRALFFKNLLALARRHPQEFTSDDVTEFEGSLETFERLLF